MASLDRDELLYLYEHGYVIMRGIIPPSMCAEAKRTIQQTPADASTHPSLLDLFRGTELMPKVLSALSPEGKVTGWAQPQNVTQPPGRSGGIEAAYDQAPQMCQVATVAPADSAAPRGERYLGHGYRAKDVPVYEPSGGPWSAHLDGVWSGGSAPPQSRDADTHDWCA